MYFFHILRKLISTYLARQNLWSTHFDSDCWLCLPPTLLCSPVSASSITCLLNQASKLGNCSLKWEKYSQNSEFQIVLCLAKPIVKMLFWSSWIISHHVSIVECEWALESRWTFGFACHLSCLWPWVLILLATYHVLALGNMLNPSEPHFVHLWIGINNSTCLPRLSWGPEEIMCVQFLDIVGIQW